jgi:CheY-like chemotaxis protein
MSAHPALVLLIDDDTELLTTMTAILTRSGYKVRTAKDGFSALCEMRDGVPDVILSDLNMPGMSGFELLSVVRRRFPTVPVIATSGAFAGHDVPEGVAADAFHQKATGIPALLNMLRSLTQPEAVLWQKVRVSAPIWIARDGDDHSCRTQIMVGCPACLRTFSEDCGEGRGSVRETDCAYCRVPIHYAIVQPETAMAPLPFN